MCVYQCVSMCMWCECTTRGGQQGALDPLELELQVAVSLLRAKFRSSAKAVCGLNHCGISPALRKH